MARTRIHSRHVEEFIRSTPNKEWVGQILRTLHRWMLEENLRLSDLRPTHIERFLAAPYRGPVKLQPRYSYKSAIVKYIAWLLAHRRVSRKVWNNFVAIRHPIRPLPEPAMAYFHWSESTLSPSTCFGRRTTLRKFHQWLDAQRIPLSDLRRGHVERWLKHLKDQGHHPTTRARTIIEIRAYLRWLHERGDVLAASHELIRREDVPKLPTYLPRPLPPDVDIELQRRLLRSDCSYKLGLALMRRTGIRSGELRSLEYHCIRTDHLKNTFLKVPLGKLNNERLVPIEEDTVALIGKLQGSGVHPRDLLLARASGAKGKAPYEPLRRAIAEAADGLNGAGKITTHRLRHTYATSLLNGGMSLVGLMRLLGHRSYKMTLRYAAITTETMGTEYFEALGKIESRYKLVRPPRGSAEHDPAKMLLDVMHWLRTRAFADGAQKRRARMLEKRLDRIRAAIEKMPIDSGS